MEDNSNRKTSSASGEDRAGPCGICQDDIKEPGNLSGCQHSFCFECIMEWARIESTCPFCRTRFTSVTHCRLLPSGEMETVATKRVSRTNQVYHQDVDEEAEAILLAMGGADDYLCVVCDLGDNGDSLLLCDGCDAACHTYCCGLDSVPPGDWYCAACEEACDQVSAVGRGRPGRRRRQEEGGNDAETTQGSAEQGQQRSRRGRRSSLISSARRAARAASRRAARGRRSSSARGAPPALPGPTLARELSRTDQLQADLDIMRSNWRAFQTRGFAPSLRGQRGGSSATSGRRSPAASASALSLEAVGAEETSWRLAEQAMRVIRPSGPPRNPQAQRIAALDAVRKRIWERRGHGNSSEAPAPSSFSLQPPVRQAEGSSSQRAREVPRQHLQLPGTSRTLPTSRRSHNFPSTPRRPTDFAILQSQRPEGLPSAFPSPGISREPCAPWSSLVDEGRAPGSGMEAHPRGSRCLASAPSVGEGAFQGGNGIAGAGPSGPGYPETVRFGAPGEEHREAPGARGKRSLEEIRPAVGSKAGAPRGGSCRLDTRARPVTQNTEVGGKRQKSGDGKSFVPPTAGKRGSSGSQDSSLCGLKRIDAVFSAGPRPSSQAKEAAFQAVRRFLKPLYEHKSLTREEYKRVAKAATHALVEARGSDCGLEFEEADVIRAVEQGRARL